MIDTPIKSALAPVEVAVIGSTGTGNNGTPLTSGTLGVTPDHQPNVILNVVTPFLAIAIRSLNVYLGSIVGLLGAGPATGLITAPDFWHLFLKCAGLSVGVVAPLMLKDIITVLSGLERKFPLATGSV